MNAKFLAGFFGVSTFMLMLYLVLNPSQESHQNDRHLIQIISKLEAENHEMSVALKTIQTEFSAFRNEFKITPAPTPKPTSPPTNSLFRGAKPPFIIGPVGKNPPFMFSIPNFPHFADFRTKMASQGLISDIAPEFRSYMNGKPKGSIFIDVGCNVGLASLPIAAMGYRSICIEPIPANIVYIKQGINANGFEDRVKIVEGAASNTTGKTIIYVPENYGDNASLGEKAAIQNVGSKTQMVGVNLFTLDTWLEQNKQEFPEEQIALLKIDVQGFELEVIQGAASFLKRHKNIEIVFEYDHRLLASSGHSRLPILQLVSSLGFDIYERIGGQMIDKDDLENFATNNQKVLDLFASKPKQEAE